METERVTGTWDELKIHPGRLTKLVSEGKIKVVGKDEFNRWIYEVDKETLEEIKKER